MYLWKCWLDTRVKFLIALGLVCVWLASAQYMIVTDRHPMKTGDLQDALFVSFIAMSSYCLFAGWVLGSESIGADIGKGSGEYLLTRPCQRGRFVWTGWMVGFLEAIVLWLLFATGILWSVYRHLNTDTNALSAWIPLEISFFKTDLPVFLLMFVINAGLVYGLTYCIGVVTRSGSRALLMSAAAIFVYEIVKSYVRHLFHVSLPELMLAYNHSDHVFQLPAVRSFVIRAIYALCFPALAHLVLQRMEI